VAHVQVTIAGRAYRLACGDGEESHLEGLAASFDARIQEMREAFGEIGDMRLHVMAALMLADEMSETKRRIKALESEVAALAAQAASDRDRAETTDRQVAATLTEAAERVELLTRSLAPGQPAS
jgi:cell division protein ZapA